MSETPGSGGVHPNEPGVDTFTDRFGHILSVVGEKAVSELATWTCAINRHLEGEHRTPVERTEALTVGGEPARLSEFHLVIKPYVIHYLTTEVTHAGLGLTLSLESTAHDDPGDRIVLDEFLGSLAFTS